MINEKALEELAKTVADNVAKNMTVGPLSNIDGKIDATVTINQDYMNGVNDTLAAVMRFLKACDYEDKL